MAPADDRTSLFELVGGRPTLERVHRIFYDKVYAHPWLGLYFRGVRQRHIEDQQTDFLTGAMGGPEIYCGRMPVSAHQHIYITPELFDLRDRLLRESLAEVGLAAALADRWLRIDNAFRRSLVKQAVSECKGRYATDVVLDFADPTRKPR